MLLQPSRWAVPVSRCGTSTTPTASLPSAASPSTTPSSRRSVTARSPCTTATGRSPTASRPTTRGAAGSWPPPGASRLTRASWRSPTRPPTCRRRCRRSPTAGPAGWRRRHGTPASRARRGRRATHRIRATMTARDVQGAGCRPSACRQPSASTVTPPRPAALCPPRRTPPRRPDQAAR